VTAFNVDVLDSIIEEANPSALRPDEFTVETLIERAREAGTVGNVARFRMRLRERLAERVRRGELTRRRVAIAGSPFAYRPVRGKADILASTERTK
jgi:hypothetical protein